MTIIIRFYQRFLSSPLHQFLSLFAGSRVGCRHTPTCSQYALESYQRYPFLKATKMSLARLLSCHPFNPQD